MNNTKQKIVTFRKQLVNYDFEQIYIPENAIDVKIVVEKEYFTQYYDDKHMVEEIIKYYVVWLIVEPVAEDD